MNFKLSIKKRNQSSRQTPRGGDKYQTHKSQIKIKNSISTQIKLIEIGISSSAIPSKANLSDGRAFSNEFTQKSSIGFSHCV